MASIVSRGTRANPRFFAKWTITTADGAKKQRWRLLPGVETLKDARAKLPEIERKVAEGNRDPLERPVEPTSAENLFLKWAGTGKPVLENGTPKRGADGEVVRDLGALKNRNSANDRTMVRKHLIPRFGRMPLEAITVHTVMEWLADLRDEGTLSAQSQRHAMATLSRFWGWCLLWRHTALPNPVKSVPTQARPVVVHAKRATLEDEKKLAELIGSLPAPVGLMLALANRTGARLGEVCGLRMDDLSDLGKGFIRVAHSYNGPLKEDRRGEGKIKKIPAPIDAAEALKMHLARRRLQGAGADDLVFLPVKKATRKRLNDWTGFRRENIRDLWWEACRKVGLVDGEGKPIATWYGATRTTAATRAAKADVDLKQIADSLGHANDETTRRHYAHFQRENFDPALRLPMMTVLGPAPKKVRAAKAK